MNWERLYVPTNMHVMCQFSCCTWEIRIAVEIVLEGSNLENVCFVTFINCPENTTGLFTQTEHFSYAQKGMFYYSIDCTLAEVF